MRTRRAVPVIKKKIKSQLALKKIACALKAKGRKIVFTNGCFDILHLGHVRYLEQAKKKGDILVVAVNSDSSVKMIKGNSRPILPEQERLSLVAALASVDYVTKFSQKTPLFLIKSIKPDVLVKGADWQKNDIAGASFVCASGGRVVRIKLVKGRSTTGIIQKIAENFKP